MSEELQDRWKLVELREVGRIVTGSTPPKARKDYYGGSFPFVKPGELLHCSVSDSVDHLSEAGSAVADIAPAGSILVSCIGNLGKSALATRLVAFNQQINAIIPTIEDQSKWIFYAVQTPDFVSNIAAASSATTISIVNKTKFSSLRIPLAPLPEQRRIVAEIEKQFTRLEAGVPSLKPRARAGSYRPRPRSPKSRIGSSRQGRSCWRGYLRSGDGVGREVGSLRSPPLLTRSTYRMYVMAGPPPALTSSLRIR